MHFLFQEKEFFGKKYENLRGYFYKTTDGQCRKPNPSTAKANILFIILLSMKIRANDIDFRCGSF